MRIKELITNQILLVCTVGNIQKTVWRTFRLMFECKKVQLESKLTLIFLFPRSVNVTKVFYSLNSMYSANRCIKGLKQIILKVYGEPFIISLLPRVTVTEKDCQKSC